MIASLIQVPITKPHREPMEPRYCAQSKEGVLVLRAPVKRSPGVPVWASSIVSFLGAPAKD